MLARACRLFDHVIIVVAAGNSPKDVTFSLEKRMSLAEENLVEYSSASVESFTGLLVDYAQKVGASVIVRGLRAVSDFEHEFQMAQMNRHLDSKLETIFLMPNEKYFYTSSNLIKQVHLHGGRETDLVPPNVLESLNDLRNRGMTQETELLS